MRKLFNIGFAMAVAIIAIALLAMPVEAKEVEDTEVYQAILEEDGMTVEGWTHYQHGVTRYEFSGTDGDEYCYGWILVEDELDENGELVIKAGECKYFDEDGRHDLVWVPERGGWVEYVGGIPYTNW